METFSSTSLSNFFGLICASSELLLEDIQRCLSSTFMHTELMNHFVSRIISIIITEWVFAPNHEYTRKLFAPDREHTNLLFAPNLTFPLPTAHSFQLTSRATL